MRIRRITVSNFRSVRHLTIDLDETTVFIGANNTGKTAVVEAVRIALTRRWGRRGTGFTELDVYVPSEGVDPKTAPPVQVVLEFEESDDAHWNPDMVAALDDVMVFTDGGRSLVRLRVSCQWSKETDAFEPVWEFLDASGEPLSQKAQRSTNFSEFFGYAPAFHLPSLRNAAEEFGARSSLWSSVLKAVKVPEAVRSEMQAAMDQLDSQLLTSDPKLGQIAATVGQAANVAVGQGAGDARLRMMPMNTWDMVSRASVVLKNETERPWLPLSHHGQGLQSLSVIFLFHAAMQQQVSDSEEGTEPILLLEEPEAHLHPQAARTLWGRITALPGQKIVTTHSPFFLQNVPIRNIRLFRLEDGCTRVAAMPRVVESELPWNEYVEKLAAHNTHLVRSPGAGRVGATSWVDLKLAESLVGCFKTESDQDAVVSKLRAFRHNARVMISAEDEQHLAILGRRVRGEIFFARHWLIVEGQSEYALLHAISRALDYSLDQHGVAVIDFQNNGDAAIYPALATAFGIPWSMITDGDAEGGKFKAQLLKRGFDEGELKGRLSTLAPPNCLEDQLVADGHEGRLRAILADVTSQTALTCGSSELLSRLKNAKLSCISRLALEVGNNPALAQQMPAPFVNVVLTLKEVNQ